MPLLEAAVREGDVLPDLKLHTHCSGTDCIAIALAAGASLARRSGLAHFAPKHLLSCENEPFKQAYLARNFPDVLLSPDVSLLAETPTGARFSTVFRGEAIVPPCDLLVGGSSCKDFSNLKMKYHVGGIEDEGTSGTTFRGIVENMFKDGANGPKLVILENVESAPWHKMEEYINGRVLLATINDKLRGSGKCSTSGDADEEDEDARGGAKKGTKSEELTFKLDGSGTSLSVDSSPAHVGVREGVRLLGVADDIDAKVRPFGKQVLKALGKRCSLSQLAKAAGLDMSGKKLTGKRLAEVKASGRHQVDQCLREYEHPSMPVLTTAPSLPHRWTSATRIRACSSSRCRASTARSASRWTRRSLGCRRRAAATTCSRGASTRSRACPIATLARGGSASSRGSRHLCSIQCPTSC